MSNHVQGGVDAQNSRFTIQVIDDTGAVVASLSNVVMDLKDLQPDGVARSARFRKIEWKDKDSCAVLQAWVLMTAPEPGT
jgi:hypothetical protein